MLIEILAKPLEWVETGAWVVTSLLDSCVATPILQRELAMPLSTVKNVQSRTKETNLKISWLQILIGILGISFFLAWELITHYYGELIIQQTFRINQSLALLPKLTREELIEFEPLPTSSKVFWTRKQKTLVILRMLGHETILYFYFGLIFFMFIVL